MTTCGNMDTVVGVIDAKGSRQRALPTTDPLTTDPLPRRRQPSHSSTPPNLLLVEVVVLCLTVSVLEMELEANARVPSLRATLLDF